MAGGERRNPDGKSRGEARPKKEQLSKRGESPSINTQMRERRGNAHPGRDYRGLAVEYRA